MHIIAQSWRSFEKKYAMLYCLCLLRLLNGVRRSGSLPPKRKGRVACIRTITVLSERLCVDEKWRCMHQFPGGINNTGDGG